MACKEEACELDEMTVEEEYIPDEDFDEAESLQEVARLNSDSKDRQATLAETAGG